MYNYTNGSDLWRTRVEGLLAATDVFFTESGIMMEVACENNGKCDVDQHSFKAYLARWMAATTKMAPFTYDRIIERLRVSAAAAALQCSGGDSGRVCGLRWQDNSTWDGSYGVGQQMAALEVVQSNLIAQSPGPLTNKTGGTSVGNPNAGSSNNDIAIVVGPSPGNGEKVGAGFLTAIVILPFVGMLWWMVMGETPVQRLPVAREVASKVKQRGHDDRQ